MSAPAQTADPVAAHVAELARTLRGPAKARRCLVREARDGLEDAVDAYRRGGLDRRSAARRAVRDFGPVAEVAPAYQDELAAGQGRRTALQLAIALPALTLGWDLVWKLGIGWGVAQSAAVPTVRALAAVQHPTSFVIAAVALGLLVLASTRILSPRPVAAAAAVAALIAILGCGGSAIAIGLVTTPDVWTVANDRLITWVAYGVSFAALVLLSRSTVRTLRTVRRPGRPGRRAATA